MSSASTTTITCPKCSRRAEFTTWQSLNATLDPDKKKELISGSLTLFICPNCQTSSPVAYPLLYHDMDRRVMIYYTAGADCANLNSVPFSKLMQDYKKRLVTERNELIEKIYLFDAEIDDRTMELFKVTIRAQMDDAEGELYFSRLGQASGGQPVMHFVHFTPQGADNFAVGREPYDELAESITSLLDQDLTPADKWLQINREYAEEFFKE